MKMLLLASLLAQPASSQSTPDEEYYLDLWKHVLSTCALSTWSDMVAAVEVQAASATSDNLGLYAHLQDSFPSIALQWDGAALSSVGALQQTLVTGLEQYVLLELYNASGSAQQAKAYFSDAPGQTLGRPSNLALIASQEARGLLATVTVDDPLQRSVLLTVDIGGVASSLVVPVVQVEAATVRGVVRDADTGLPLAGRVSALGSDGVLRRGEAFFDVPTLSFKPIVPGTLIGDYWLPFFYSELDGSYEVRVPPGELTLGLERGFEFDVVALPTSVGPGQTLEQDLTSGRWIDMRAKGWYSGDTHVHWSVPTFHEDEDYALLPLVQRAEDVAVVSNLTLRAYDPIHGEFIAPDDYPPGPIAELSDAEYLVEQGEEYRNSPFYGHLNFLGIDEMVQPISTGDMLGPTGIDYPVNYHKILEAQAQGGIALAAHGVAGSVASEIALGVITSIDNVEPLDYYELLDAGLRLPISAGSDHPARLLGQARCYVQIDEPFTYAAWLEGLAAGRTFTTSGPLLELSIEGAGVGDELLVKAGEPLTILATARSRHPIGRLELVSNGHVIASVDTQDTTATIELNQLADISRWILARCSRSASHEPHKARDVAHSSPMWITVDGERIFDLAAAQALRAACIYGGQNVAQGGLFETSAQAQEAADVFDSGASFYDELQYYPDFSASPRVGQAPLLVQFTDESTNSPTSYAWDFENDGVVDAVDANPQHVFATPGLYSVRLETPGTLGDTDDLKLDYVWVQGLSSDTESISLAAGGSANFSLCAGPALAGSLYLLLGSEGGTQPGLPVDGLVLPLNPGPYLTATLKSPQLLMTGSIGLLQGDGTAAAKLTLPALAPPGLAGLTLHHAYIVLGANLVAASTSNAVGIELLP